MKEAIIIGASSGIGKELAKILDAKKYSIGIVGRRVNLLKELQSTLRNNSNELNRSIFMPLGCHAQA